jgi:hypothetical protein
MGGGGGRRVEEGGKSGKGEGGKGEGRGELKHFLKNENFKKN